MSVSPQRPLFGAFTARTDGSVIGESSYNVEPPLLSSQIQQRPGHPLGVVPATDAPSKPGADPRSPRRNWTWAQLMARAFDVDVLCCRRCGGRLRLMGTILDPRAIQALLIMRSLGLPTETADRAPPGAPRG